MDMGKGRVERFALTVEKYVPDAITSAVSMVRHRFSPG